MPILILTDNLEFSIALSRYLINTVDKKLIIYPSHFYDEKIEYKDYDFFIVEAYQTYANTIHNQGIGLIWDLRKLGKKVLLIYNVCGKNPEKDFCLKLPNRVGCQFSEIIRSHINDPSRVLEMSEIEHLKECFPTFYTSEHH